MQEVNIDGTVGPYTDLPNNPAKAMGRIIEALQDPTVDYVKVRLKRQVAKKRRPQRKKKRKSAKAQRRANRSK